MMSKLCSVSRSILGGYQERQSHLAFLSDHRGDPKAHLSLRESDDRPPGHGVGSRWLQGQLDAAEGRLTNQSDPAVSVCPLSRLACRAGSHNC